MTRLLAQAAPSGFVSRVGTKLYKDGVPWKFDGINIYQANSKGVFCSYDMQSGSLLAGELDVLYRAETMRCWFYQPFVQTGAVRDWTVFDKTLAIAKAHSVKVIAVLADQQGSCDIPVATYKNKAWYQTAYKTIESTNAQSYRDYVQAVVTRYNNDPTILMWEFMNEAECLNGASCDADSGTVMKAWASDIAGMVKAIDPNHLTCVGLSVHCGGIGEDYQASQSSPNIDVIDFHDYNNMATALPLPFTTALAAANALNKPLVVGEAGIIAGTTVTLATRSSQFDAKMAAQFAAGANGFLFWADRTIAQGGSVNNPDDFNIGPTDPAIALLSKY